MAPVDWLILAIIAVSTLISIKRGFVKEALSLVSWIAAFLVARMFGHHLAALLVDQISIPSVRLGVSFALLFIATLILGSVVNYLVGELIKITGLSGADRVFGMVFGAARGVLIIVVLVAVARLTPMVEDPWWQASFLIPHFQEIEDQLRELLLGNQDLLSA